ncbi:right-handed parallel beta-helix repeat-containing protein [Cohnella hashimotonis]|uniref:Right-handed parallel beta-helix repeat-containing protein n=1 Tax=Cohnella hashimotonis TaxID=2826895 RepID=A0ABT6TR26_9BACL|nr:right-handed parallel beta-helix repeat-containing protein [Cohnella hashimotonis]MDI4649235.1 right-handed parallel beta-helix repeat-containing protein [Cohnella hashimotonis]
MLRAGLQVNGMATRIMLAALLLLSGLSLPMSPVLASSMTYYVDPAGDDAGSGTTPATAWRTLGKINGTTFGPGDRILFKSGGVWTGQLWPKGSGAAGNPVVIDRYGSGAAPVIAGDRSTDASLSAAVKLENQSYWTVQNLKITFPAAGNDNWKRSGVYVHASQNGTYGGIHLLNLEVADVKSISCWECTDGNGQTVGAFNNAAIYVMTEEDPNNFHQSPSPVTNARFDDLLIQNNTIRDSTGIGILMMNRFGPITANPEANFHYSTNVRVAGNTIRNIGRDAIVIGGADAPVIERNSAYDLGHISRNGVSDQRLIAGMFAFVSRNPLFQYNEVARIADMGPGQDGEAWDNDWGNTGTVTYQYNYSHDNAGGIILQQENTRSDWLVFRYNISVNDGAGTDLGARFLIDKPGVQAYNNTIYTTGRIQAYCQLGDPSVVCGSALKQNVYFWNNLFVGSQGNFDSGYSYDYNLFHGFTGPADAHKLNADPQFQAPVPGMDGMDAASGFRLAAGSPALASGTPVSYNGGQDYWGNPVSATAQPNRGAYNGAAVAGVVSSVVNDSGLSYTGSSWAVSSNRQVGDYLDDVHYATQNGDSVSYAFTGDGIDLIGEMNVDQGLVDVYIDNVWVQTIDTYAAARQAQQHVFVKRGLSPGTHTLKAVKKSGTYMTIDAVAVPKYVNDTDATMAAEYIGAWGYSNARGVGDYGDDVHYASQNGDSFDYAFYGSGIELLSERSGDQGLADVYVDGVFVQRIDAYTSGPRQAMQSVFSQSGLTIGYHRLKVVKASGTYMIVDGTIVH